MNHHARFFADFAVCLACSCLLASSISTERPTIKRAGLLSHRYWIFVDAAGRLASE
jgi:hypothetical protein